MPYNPKDPESGRRSIRLPEYDYTQPGAYFITVVTHDREYLFGEIVDGEMVLSPFGKVVEWVWKHVPDHFANVETDASVVMPNHAHGVLWILDDDKGRGDAFHERIFSKWIGSSDKPSLDETIGGRNASPYPAGCTSRNPYPRTTWLHSCCGLASRKRPRKRLISPSTACLLTPSGFSSGHTAAMMSPCDTGWPVRS